MCLSLASAATPLASIANQSSHAVKHQALRVITNPKPFGDPPVLAISVVGAGVNILPRQLIWQ
jgi:hypothetical protein